MADWYPPATKNHQTSNGGSMLGGPARGVLHTTETTSMSSGAPYYHIGFKDTPGGVHIVQWRPFGRAGRGLRNLRGGIQTNRRGAKCVQAVVIDYARNSADWSNKLLDALNTFMEWCEAGLDVPLNASPLAGGGSECYGYHSPCRMTGTQWNAFNGWCGHQNVPENTHWDPGKANWDALMNGVDGVVTPPPVSWTEELIMELPTLQVGDGFTSTGKAHLRQNVKNAQGLLMANGFKDEKSVDPVAAADGFFGPGTETSTEGFQRSVGLNPDGVIGPKTWAELLGV